MDRLPLELHTAIYRELSSNDMASLALCSHNHAALVRPLLYEHITMLGGVPQRYKDIYWSQRRYEHGCLFALVTTILSRPSFFGPFVKSINIAYTERSSESDLGEIALFFQAMSNLRSLRFGTNLPISPEFISQVSVSAISPSLVVFECNHTPAVPSIFDFLRSHPNLSVLRLGTLRNQHQNGQDESQHRFESISKSLRADTELLNLASLELKVDSGVLAFSTELLLRVSNTHLERLSIAYSDPSSTRLNGSVLNHLDALYHVCSARLNHLIIEDTPHQCPQSFSWIISHVLPRIPHLRTLELRQAQYQYRTNESQPQRVLHTDSLILTSGESDAIDISALPMKLETVRWVGTDAYFPSARSGLSPLGVSNSKALFELFPSLKVVEYHERGYVFIFRRTEGGVIKRQTMRGIPPADLNPFTWG